MLFYLCACLHAIPFPLERKGAPLKATFKGVGWGKMKASGRRDTCAEVLNGEQELASPRNEKKAWAKVEGHGVAWGMWKCVTGSELLELRDRRSGGEAGGVSMG